MKGPLVKIKVKLLSLRQCARLLRISYLKIRIRRFVQLDIRSYDN